MKNILHSISHAQRSQKFLCTDIYIYVTVTNALIVLTDIESVTISIIFTSICIRLNLRKLH